MNNGTCSLQDGSAPDNYLETHPQWVTNGFITGTYTLTTPITPGDHFRATVGIIRCNDINIVEPAAVTFQVLVDGSAVANVDANNSATTLHTIDADLSGFVGASHITLKVTGHNDQSMQCWAAWVDPTVGG
jgi:hypothetical protein